jgi:hypothetical protein
MGDILDLAKVDAGKLELYEDAGVDPECVISACVALMRIERVAGFASTGRRSFAASHCRPG